MFFFFDCVVVVNFKGILLMFLICCVFNLVMKIVKNIVIFMVIKVVCLFCYEIILDVVMYNFF